MKPQKLRRFVGHCSNCDRDVVQKIDLDRVQNTNKVMVECCKCETPVPCKGNTQ